MQVEHRILCPECRREAVVPEGGVKDLENNFFINRLVDQLVLKRKVEGEAEVKCDECEEDEPVVAYCPDCNLFFCDVHNEAHKRNKKYHNHKMIPLTELRSKKDMPIRPKLKTPMCKKHDIELLFYCETCEELICVYCTVKEHSGHAHDTARTMANKHNFVKDISTSLEEMITGLTAVQDNVVKMQEMIVKQGKEIEGRIDEYYDYFSQKLAEQKDEMKKQLCDMLSHKKKAGLSQLKKLESAQKEMWLMKDLNSAVENSSDQEKLSVKNQLTGQVREMQEQYQKLNISPTEGDTVKLIVHKNTFPQLSQFYSTANSDPLNSEIIDIPGYALKGSKIEFLIVTRDSSKCLCYNGGSKVCVQLESPTKKVTSAVVKDNEDGTYTASFVPQKVGEIKLSVSVDDVEIMKRPIIIVVHKSYLTLDKQSTLVTISGKMDRPWGVAVDSKGTWAVTDYTNHFVYLFDNQDQLVKELGGEGTENGQFSSPKGVAFDEHNHLYVADFDNHRVQRFDTDGKYLSQFGSGKSSTELMNLSCPVGVTVSNNRVYIADSNNKRISVFQTNGLFCLSFGSEQLGRPYDVAVYDNQLFAADYFHHCVYIFTLDGYFTGKLSNTGRHQLNSPCSVAADLTGHIFVADTWNHRVSIFDKDGDFLHCFGQYGSGKGKFQYPNGIAIGPTGNVFITDHDNHRIQIYY